jgi:hypothetical protein
MERPTGVTILAVLYFLGAACLVLLGILSIVGGSLLSGLAHGGGPASALFAMGGVFIGAILLVLAVLDVAIAVGFLKLQNWARIVAIILTGIGVLFGLLGLVTMLAHLMVFLLIFRLVVLAIEVWILVYLFQANVKQAFGATGF